MNLENKTIAEIAAIIRKDWQKVNFAAKPYLEAMGSLNSIKSYFGYDTGKSVMTATFILASLIAAWAVVIEYLIVSFKL